MRSLFALRGVGVVLAVLALVAPASAQQIVLDRGRAAGKFWLFPIAGDPHSYLYAVLNPVERPSDVVQPFLHEDVFLPAYPPAESEAWAITQRAILELDREVRSRGGVLAVLAAPSSYEINEDWARADLPATDGYEFGKPSRMLSEFAQQQGLLHVGLADPFKTFLREGRQPFFRKDSHWNSEGHALAGRTLADWILENRVALRLGAPTAPGTVPVSHRDGRTLSDRPTPDRQGPA